MAVRYKRLWDSFLVVATGDTVPNKLVLDATDYVVFGRVVLTNTDSAVRSVNIWIVREGQDGALDAVEKLVDGKSIQPSESWICEELEGEALNPTDMLFMDASAASVISCHGSGYEIDS